MTTLKEFKIILYEQTVLHFTVKTADSDDAHDIALETYYGWSPDERAEYNSTEQGGIDLDIEEAVQ